MKNKFLSQEECRFLYILSLFLLCLLSPMWAQSNAQRKKVAIVLSGGGAKGVAHIGVMKVIERAGIPVDMVTGTSMGSIVGGLYCCGWNAQLLDSIVRKQDWNFLLSDRDNYYSQNLFKRRKQNTYFLSKTFVFDKDKKTTTGGLVKGKNLDQLFEHLTKGYHDSMDFSHLPIPFACVATNIIDNTEHDFHSGILARAMRASMSIPGFFTPIRMGDKLLVDGGLRNNYPADIARSMGADYIIGSTVQGESKTADELNSSSAIIGQIIDVNCRHKYDENIAITNIPIHVNVDGYGAASFNRAAIDTLIRRGEEAAMAHWDELMALKRKLGLPDNYKPRPHKPNPMAMQPIDFKKDARNRRPDHNMLQGNLGVRFDTEELVALQLNGVYSLAHAPLDIEGTVRLGRNIMVGTKAMWMSNGLVNMSLDYNFYRHDIEVYEKGNNNYSITFNQHQARLRALNIDVKNLAMDIGVQWDYYNFYKLLVSNNSEHKNLTLNNEHLLSYHANFRYNSENTGLFPTRGAKFQAEYAYFTDNLLQYNGHKGFSELSAGWQMSFKLTKRLTLQPLLYGRMLFGDDIPLIRQNFIGGQWFGHYIDQQMPFVGVSWLERTDSKFAACQIKLQERLSTNNYILLKVVGAQHADKLDDIFAKGPTMGYQAAYYYRSMFGPMGATIGYSSKSKKINFFVNLGFEF